MTGRGRHSRFRILVHHDGEVPGEQQLPRHFPHAFEGRQDLQFRDGVTHALHPAPEQRVPVRDPGRAREFTHRKPGGPLAFATGLMIFCLVVQAPLGRNFITCKTPAVIRG